ncbi:AAA family ATPase [Deinococcus hopiensis]|uniref:AAA family ATPase n=1 Tax=Deinococcus hopiensis TaxID=309885 RepID=UPI001BAF8BE0|nr:ATP-binding protein [Deinococcus hopiensis]
MIKKMFKSYATGQHDAFMEAAQDVILDERKKQHVVLANELTRLLNGASTTRPDFPLASLQPVPRDPEKGLPLFDIKTPQKRMEDLFTTKGQEQALWDVMNEFKQWEILEMYSLKPAQKLLFCGPPGCGKTITAEAIASELGLPMLYVRFDGLVSSLLGETASNLSRVFEYVTRGQWVVFFDEFDAIGRSRDDSTEHGELKRVVNAFLQMLDRFEGRSLVIAATNFEQALDPALWRRFDEVFRFEKPDEETILRLLTRLLKRNLKKTNILPSISRELVGFSHADVERICLDAIKRTVLAGGMYVEEQDLIRAVAKQRDRQKILNFRHSTTSPTVDEE